MIWKPALSQALRVSLERRAGVLDHGGWSASASWNLGEPERSWKEASNKTVKADRRR